MRGTLHPGVIHHSPHDAAAVACRGQNQQHLLFLGDGQAEKLTAFARLRALGVQHRAPCGARRARRVHHGIRMATVDNGDDQFIQKRSRHIRHLSHDDVLSLRETAQAGCARHAAHRGCKGNARAGHIQPHLAYQAGQQPPGPRTRGHGPQQRLFALFQAQKIQQLFACRSPARQAVGRFYSLIPEKVQKRLSVPASDDQIYQT